MKGVLEFSGHDRKNGVYGRTLLEHLPYTHLELLAA